MTPKQQLKNLIEQLLDEKAALGVSWALKSLLIERPSMTTSWLIDTNVLIYSYDQTQKLHPPSYRLLECATAGEINASISQ